MKDGLPSLDIASNSNVTGASGIILGCRFPLYLSLRLLRREKLGCSILTTIVTDKRNSLFAYGLNTGGPGVITVGWIVVGFFSKYFGKTARTSSHSDRMTALFVATSMAEIVSAVPVAGGPYFWAYMLAPQQHAPFLSWFTGW
jgi:hypothetical protein